MPIFLIQNMYLLRRCHLIQPQLMQKLDIRWEQYVDTQKNTAAKSRFRRKKFIRAYQ